MATLPIYPNRKKGSFNETKQNLNRSFAFQRLLSGCGENSGTSYIIRVMNLFFPKTPDIAKETTWKEEVQLQDGTRIWVRRTVVGKAHQDMMNGPGRGEYRVSAYRLEVIDSAGFRASRMGEQVGKHDY